MLAPPSHEAAEMQTVLESGARPTEDYTQPPTTRPFCRRDAALMLAVAVCMAAAAWTVHRAMDPRFLALPVGNDVWFEADVPTLRDTILHRWSNQSRNARHPLFPLLISLPSYGLRAAGLSDRAAIAVLIVLGAAAWSATLYVLTRAATGRRLDAVVFTALSCVTSGAMFWLAVPETYAWSSLSLLLVLALCATDRDGRRGAVWYVGGAALCLGMTTSNWMAGLFVAAARHPWRRALQIAANSLCVVVLLWSVQRVVFPTAEFFIGYVSDAKFITPAAAGGPGPVARALFFHSVVMPAIQIVQEPKWGPIMSVQRSSIGSAGVWGLLATALWLPMLGFAIRGLAGSAENPGFRGALAATLAGQVLLFMIYGEETFLYSLQVAPLLVLAAALATRTPQRRIVLGLAGALIVAAAVNNARQLAQAMAFFQNGVR
jgi:hypothetical protein